MSELNNIASYINYMGVLEEMIKESLKNGQIDNKDLISLLSKRGKKIYKRIKRK